ncbi:uncharacterized protein N7511_001765 [Penicillium nucicola]|uniref:uncharacterized protein n=1 Tax=Penicillium nucicola TaxID=1850975 RepID=UPI0025454653|nr:uncharacterized protein N7511_001765 [Penicillium nucicola]KAJ5776754.1 hypothetical protein N7511_001765 [Penicillium nucicola]
MVFFVDMGVTQWTQAPAIADGGLFSAGFDTYLFRSPLLATLTLYGMSSQNTNDPWLEQPGGQHIFQNTQAVEAGQVISQAFNPISTQVPSNFDQEVYNTVPKGGISIAQFRDASANSNAKKA